MKKFLLIISLAFLLCFTFGCKQQPAEETGEQMTREDAKALLDNVLLILNERRLDLIEKHYAPDLILKTSSMLQTSKGYEGFRTWLNSVYTSRPDSHITFDEIYVDGNVIFTRWSGKGTNTGPLGEVPATGRSFSNSGLSFYRIENGMIAEMEVVFDNLSTMLQLGFSLVPPQPPELQEEKK